MIIKVIVYCLLAIFASTFAGTGTAGAQFLQIGAGSRALGMGSAFVAYAEDIDAIFWNPAGLSKLTDGNNLSITHLNYFAEMNYENIAYSMPFMEGALGLSMVGLLSGDIEVTTVEQQEGTGESYSANDFVAAVSYGKNITDKFSVGASFKYIYMSLADLNAQGWAMDFGAIYNTGILNNLRIGFVVSNFGPDMRYEGDDLVFKTRVFKNQDDQQEDARAEYVTELFQLPLKLQLGIALDIIDNEHQKLVTTFDGINPNDYEETFGIGLEYIFKERYFLRAGYTRVFEKGISAGAGALLNISEDFSMLLNYGFEDHNYLGDLHRIGINFKF